MLALRTRVDPYVLSYSNALTKNPIRTKLVSCFALTCVGDFLCQGIMRYKYRNDFKALTDLNLHKYSPSRTLRQGVAGMFALAIPMHYWIMYVVPWITVSPKLIPNARLNYIATVIWRLGVHNLIMNAYCSAAILFGIGAL